MTRRSPSNRCWRERRWANSSPSKRTLLPRSEDPRRQAAMIDMTPQEIEQMFADAVIGRLCMADTDGTPYSIPLPFCWENGALYVRLPLTGRKGQVLARNDRVCFEVDRFTASLDDYASALVEGRLVEVTSV